MSVNGLHNWQIIEDLRLQMQQASQQDSYQQHLAQQACAHQHNPIWQQQLNQRQMAASNILHEAFYPPSFEQDLAKVCKRHGKRTPEEEAKLREKYPTLQSAWDAYQIVLRMVESQEENGPEDSK